MADVFVSYKREDEIRVSGLVEALRKRGIDVWWDADIPPGAPWEETIEKNLTSAASVVVIWSPAAIASENVRAEARWARARGRLLQVFIEECEPPLFFGERQGVNLRHWRGDLDDEALVALINGIRGIRQTGSHGVEGGVGQLASTAAGRRRQGATELREGAVLNGLFRIRRMLGQGETSAVYEGVNIATDEAVAIKAVDLHWFHKPSLRQEFIGLSNRLTRLVDDGIPRYHMVAVDQPRGIVYSVQELVLGFPLAPLIGQVLANEVSVVAFAQRMAGALACAHRAGIVHQQLSPDTVLLADGQLDRCKIIDFALGESAHRSFAAVGAAPYRAPEQADFAGRDVGPWTDVYSLGMIIRALIEGRHPEPAADAGTRISRDRGRLGRLLEDMLALDPAERIPNMETVLKHLGR